MVSPVVPRPAIPGSGLWFWGPPAEVTPEDSDLSLWGSRSQGRRPRRPAGAGGVLFIGIPSGEPQGFPLEPGTHQERDGAHVFPGGLAQVLQGSAPSTSPK